MAKSFSSSISKRIFESEVNFARFFTVPTMDRPAPAPLTWNTRWNDTWLRCRGTASISLFLLPNTSTKKFGLAVSLGDDLIEEHVLYNLVFSWPQVSCVPECPITRSSTVFITYQDHSSQIQKFAVRFSDSHAAERFLNCVKECSEEMRADSLNKETSPESNLSSISSGVPLKNHYIHNRKRTVNNVKRSEEEPIAICRVDGVPHSLDSTNYNNSIYNNDMDKYNNEMGKCNNEMNYSLIESIMGCDDLDSLLGLPPSFTDLLSNCSSSNPPGEIVPAGGTHNCYQNSVPIVAQESTVMNETDLMAQIMKYMNDESFQATVCKMEKLVGELGQGWFL